ncbi:MAG: site-specific DNA-methyltransferase [Gammaproteobacteria bacterium]
MAKDYRDWDKETLIAEIESLRRRKKFGLVWEDKPEEVVDRCRSELPVLEEVKSLAIAADGDAPTNLLIEGDNYHALSVLNYTHAGKIDVIYIDPPYNTGAKDWKYNNDFVDKNDGYRHSKWLSMMANRLALAKNLLKEDGVLICTIDENERSRLELLVEELFYPRALTSVSIVHNPQGVQGDNFSYTHETAIFVIPKIKNRINKVDVEPRKEILRDDTGNSYLRTNARNCFYPIFVRDDEIIGFGDVPNDDFHPADRTVQRETHTEIWPIKNGVERKWRYARQSIDKIKIDLIVKDTKRGKNIFQIKRKGTPKTVWADPKHHAGGKFGTGLLGAMVGAGKFNFPKSLFSVLDAIKLCVKKDSIVLDFFAGSGTTGHAISLLNKEDGGRRRFILCTNNENGIAREVCHPRIKAVIKGHEDLPDITGIPSNLRYFKTAFVPSRKNPTDQDKIRLTQKAAEMICVRENTFAPVKETKAYKIFRDGARYTAVLYDERAIPSVKTFAAKTDGKFVAYIFSLGDNDFADEFADMRGKIVSRAIPEAILRVYRRIFGGTK